MIKQLTIAVVLLLVVSALVGFGLVSSAKGLPSGDLKTGLMSYGNFLMMPLQLVLMLVVAAIALLLLFWVFGSARDYRREIS